MNTQPFCLYISFKVCIIARSSLCVQSNSEAFTNISRVHKTICSRYLIVFSQNLINFSHTTFFSMDSSSIGINASLDLGTVRLLLDWHVHFVASWVSHSTQQTDNNWKWYDAPFFLPDSFSRPVLPQSLLPSMIRIAEDGEFIRRSKPKVSLQDTVVMFHLSSSPLLHSTTSTQSLYSLSASL